MMRSAPPATADEVWITRDGRRLDTAEQILEHIGQLNAELADAPGDDVGQGRQRC